MADNILGNNFANDKGMWEMYITKCKYLIYKNYLMYLYFKLWTHGPPH